MPEIVAIGSVGALLTFLLANFNLYVVHRSFSDQKIKILNSNLAQLGWYWSLDQGAPIAISEQDLQLVSENDYKKSTRNAFLFGTIMIFLSWLGLIILSLYMISVYKIAKTTTEKKIMNSDLVKKEINNVEEIRQLLSQATGII